MSLRPKELDSLDFMDVWSEVLPTVRSIVSCGQVEHSMWAKCFKYPLCPKHICVTKCLENMMSLNAVQMLNV